jgi:hypothetical protein
MLESNRPISVSRLGEMPIQSCGQSVSAPRGKVGVSLNAHTELRTKRQRSAREAIYRNRPVAHQRCGGQHLRPYLIVSQAQAIHTPVDAVIQGLTLAHFSAQLEPFLTQTNALYTPRHLVDTP